MTPEAAHRFARHLTLPDVGPAGQESILAATVAVVGDDVACDTAALYLAAAGVGKLRTIRPSSERVRQFMQTFDLETPQEIVPWPAGLTVDATASAWLAALAGCACVVRSGFDDDPMLGAAARLGIPAVLVRGRDDRVEIASFRNRAASASPSLAVPTVRAAVSPDNGAGGVIAGTLAAAEVLTLIVGVADRRSAQARRVTLPLDGGDIISTDIPWPAV